MCGDLDVARWDAPTGCPGWSVKDNVSHICDIEHMLLGDPRPDAVETPFGAHVVNPVGERMEPGVEMRRSWTAEAVLDDLVETSRRRVAQVASIDAAGLEETAHGHPFGPMPMHRFLTLRVFDMFTHEHDIRRAVGKPGGVAGPAAALTVPFAVKALARLLFDNEAALRGTVMGLHVEDLATTLDFTGERAQTRDWTGAQGPQLSFDTGNFMAWVGGRSDRSDFGFCGEASTADIERAAAAFRAHAAMTP